MPAAYLPSVLVFETDVRPVTAGGLTPGWIAGSPANLADGASVDCRFDLGPDWAQYVLAQIIVLSVTATSLEGIQVTGSDTTTKNTSRRLRASDSTVFGTTFSTVTTAQGPQAAYVRPAGRYLTVAVTNTALGGVQGATAKITVALYPV